MSRRPTDEDCEVLELLVADENLDDASAVFAGTASYTPVS